MLRATPPGEDGAPGRGGNGRGRRGPAGEDGIEKPFAPLDLDHRSDDDDEDGNGAALYRAQSGYAMDGEEGDDDGIEFDERPSEDEFLQMVQEADSQALQYVSQVNRQSWERNYRAYHQEHFSGSKYLTDDYNNRSRLFVPKTRTAVRKDMAATAASMFGSVDAINCEPGNEGDPQQRGAAAIIKELVAYRTNRSSGKASIPWFAVAMGSRQTALLTGICLSKQYWKLELKRKGSETFHDDDGTEKERDVWVPHIDRPESELFPPENYVIDSAADWRNPAQDAAYVILKYPMRMDEIRRRQKDPRNPWRKLDEEQLRASGEGAQMEAESIRRAREQGLDRFDRTQTTRHFDIIWVWETFIRTAGQDWNFVSIGNKHMLTDPRPTEEVYPEQFGERPLALGFGALEAFRIFPMSPVESWQMLQQETNDIRNLSLDALKQNIMPVSKVVRGKNVDLDQLKRRGQGSSIMVTNKDDVTWEKAPDLSEAVTAMTQKLDIEFDDLSGQQNYGTVQDNNNLGKTLGGLKLAAGAANSVQEFDIRIWIETWCEPVLSQIVRLEQFYESDPIILGICGDRAQLMQKYGINEISNELLENNVTISCNVGLGSGDPQQRLAKFNSATQIALPLLQLDPDFKNGKKQMNSETIMEEVYGAAGYKDGGKRFIKDGQPLPQNPTMQPQIDKLVSETQKNRALAKAAVLNALSNAAKVGLGLKELEDDWVNSQFQRSVAHMDQLGKAADLGSQHADAHMARKNAARGVNPDGTPLLPSPEATAGGGDDGGGSDGASPGVAAGGGTSPPPSDLGAGNAGVDPATLGDHGVPAGDSGQQQQQDQAAEGQQLEQTLKKQPKSRTVKIAKRGADGRASEFHITDDGGDEAAPAQAAPKGGSVDHSAAIAELGRIAAMLNRPRKVVRDANGKATGIE